MRIQLYNKMLTACASCKINILSSGSMDEVKNAGVQNLLRGHSGFVQAAV